MGLFTKLFGGKKKPSINSKGMKKADFTKRWDLRGRTGQGSMSKVYQAYDRERRREVGRDEEKIKQAEKAWREAGGEADLLIQPMCKCGQWAGSQWLGRPCERCEHDAEHSAAPIEAMELRMAHKVHSESRGTLEDRSAQGATA